MFLSRRATQAEYFDAERPAPEVREFFRHLNEVNRLFAFSQPFEHYLPGLLGDPGPREVSILDLGSGDGTLGRTLERWADSRGWHWCVTNLDLNQRPLAQTPGRSVRASVLALPFQDESFDVAIASQMTHHLSDAEAECHLREAWRVCRSGILICDLHRNLGLYAGLWLLCLLRNYPRVFRADALLSVKRAWRLGELRELARRAGIPDPRLQLYFGARSVLQARKDRHQRNQRTVSRTG